MAYDTEPDPQQQGGEDSEPTSIYLTSEQLGGKQYKAGDSIVLKVTDTDPSSGEVECTVSGGGERDQNSSMQSFDQAMA